MAAPSDVADPAVVLVLGNGPVGQTAALLLARWGVRVVLLDRRARRDDRGSKAVCQHRESLDIWSHVGAGDRIAAEGLTWDRSVILHGDVELFRQGYVDAGISPYPPFVNLGQHRVEQILDERIAQEPLIDVRWGHEVVGLEQDEHGVRLLCRRAPTGAGDPVLLAGAYAIACTGADDEDVRRMLGQRIDGVTFPDRLLMCEVRAALPGWEHERRFSFEPDWNPGRQVLIHPIPDSTYRLDWQLPPDFDLAAEEADGRLDQRLRRILGEADYELRWRAVYPLRAGRVRRMRVGRVLIAGDAAHLLSPFGARGLNSGVADAENAAWKIAYVVRGWAQPALLETYHDERAAAAAENLAIARATMEFLVPPDEAASRRRRALLSAARTDPTALALVESGRLAESSCYVASPLTMPDPRRPDDARPPSGPAGDAGPGRCLPDVPICWEGATRLRQIVRHGITVLLAPGMESRAVAVVRALADLAAPGPLRVVAMRELSGPVVPALGAADGEVWVVRPDAYVAAIVPAGGLPGQSQPAAVAAAVAAITGLGRLGTR
ncbi:MAG: FAD-dependent monooxygenase [Austwickia sp.]|nr:FAD-dependent monooxygenase [Austwickia sp.]MCO5308548.1 FAD-dependent monooxygenase [Austwickia sp.]